MSYETDERLKGYLDTNQLHREQMCLAVLKIDRRFSNVHSRHPRGGPDGARDIEAMLDGVLRVFGAVGFVNQASDSKPHKHAAKKKFRDDLAAALKQHPKPESFIFFTNVNLTVVEEDDLVAHAKSLGLAHAEVFDRERIRIALDSPDGLSIRFQYLKLSMSETEQAAFFARWGDDIQAVIADGFGRIEQSLNRIQFLQESMAYLSNFTAVLQLDREYAGHEIGHFRAFIKLYLKGPAHGIMGFIACRTDNCARLGATTVEQLSAGQAGISNGMCGAQWEFKIPEEMADNETADRESEGAPKLRLEHGGCWNSVGEDPVKAIRILYNRDTFIRLLPPLRLVDIDECMFIFSLNRRLAEKVRTVRIYANEYKVAEISGQEFLIDHTAFEPQAPLFFNVDELADPWVRLRPQIASTFHLRFSEQTPRRFINANEVTGTLA